MDYFPIFILPDEFLGIISSSSKANSKYEFKQFHFFLSFLYSLLYTQISDIGLCDSYYFLKLINEVILHLESLFERTVDRTAKTTD